MTNNFLLSLKIPWWQYYMNKFLVLFLIQKKFRCKIQKYCRRHPFWSVKAGHRENGLQTVPPFQWIKKSVKKIDISTVESSWGDIKGPLAASTATPRFKNGYIFSVGITRMTGFVNCLLQCCKLTSAYSIWEHWVPNGKLNNLPLGFSSSDHANSDNS